MQNTYDKWISPLCINTWDIIWFLRYIQLSREQKLYFIICIIDQNNNDFTHQEGKNNEGALYWQPTYQCLKNSEKNLFWGDCFNIFSCLSENMLSISNKFYNQNFFTSHYDPQVKTWNVLHYENLPSPCLETCLEYPLNFLLELFSSLKTKGKEQQRHHQARAEDRHNQGILRLTVFLQISTQYMFWKHWVRLSANELLIVSQVIQLKFMAKQRQNKMLRVSIFTVHLQYLFDQT